MLFTLAMNNNSDKFQKHPPAMGEIRLNRLYLYVRVCLHTRACERGGKMGEKERETW